MSCGTVAARGVCGVHRLTPASTTVAAVQHVAVGVSTQKAPWKGKTPKRSTPLPVHCAAQRPTNQAARTSRSVCLSFSVRYAACSPKYCRTKPRYSDRLRCSTERCLSLLVGNSPCTRRHHRTQESAKTNNKQQTTQQQKVLVVAASAHTLSHRLTNNNFHAVGRIPDGMPPHASVVRAAGTTRDSLA